MNHTSKLNCTTEMRHGQWARACCDVGWKQCHPGCCKPGNACGVRVVGGEPCCIPRDAPQAQQFADACCVVGVGVNCESPAQMDACCLSSESAREPDRHVPCQPHNCSNFVRCPFGTGYDCAGDEGRPESKGKKRCCLPSGADPHGKCQPDQTCSSYAPCQRTGVDCTSEYGAHCCLERGDQGACRESCDGYREEQQQWQRRERVAIFIVFALVCCAVLIQLGIWAWKCYRRCAPIPEHVDHIRLVVDRTGEDVTGTRQAVDVVAKDVQKATALLVDNGRSVLMPNGSTLPSRPLVEFCVRVALTFGCTAYANARLLPGGRRSAERVGEALRQLGFTWINRRDPTKSGIVEGLSEVMRLVQGYARALIFIYFGGHGTEGDDGLCWYGTDGDPEDRTTQFSVRRMYRQVMDAALRPSVAAEHFGCDRQLGELCIVNVADCCRTDVAGSVMDADGVLAKIYDAPTKTNPLGSRVEPSFLTIFTADVGREASDGTPDDGSPWVQAFVDRLERWPYEPVAPFFAEVGLAASRIAGGRQRCGQRFDDNMVWPVCLAAWPPAGASTDASTMAGTSSSSLGGIADVASSSSEPMSA